MQHIWRAFLRLFFRLLYNEFAWSYDLVAWLVSLGQWKAWGRTTLSHLPRDRVLELGHGPGHLLAALAAEEYTPIGLDLSPAMARQAQQRLQKAELQVPLVRGRAQALPFRGSSFDSVVATFPTEFIVDPHTLQELTRILPPEGRLTVAVGVRFEGEDLVSSFLSWLYRVTGQNQSFPDSFIAQLKQVGLSPQVTWEKVNRAAVLLIVAEKQ